MKNILIIGILAGLLIAGYYYFTQNEEGAVVVENTDEEVVGSSDGAVRGVVTGVNYEQMAVDGPGLVTIVDAQGEAHVIALPAMGLTMCEAYERITAGYDVAVGDTLEVKGEMTPNGEILPCASENHYLEVL